MWAVIDQAAFALSNFCISLLLARWLTLDEYGAFAVSLTVFYLAGNIHTGLFIEPMLVFGPSKYRGCIPEYVSVLRKWHWLATTTGSLLLLLAGLVAWLEGLVVLASALFGIGVSAPFILFLWLMRRTCYIELKPERAAQASIWHFAVMMAGMFALHQTQMLTVFSALLVIGIASLGAGWSISGQLRPTAEPLETLKTSIWLAHRKYGAWACGTNIMMWVPGNFAIVVLPIWLGLEAAGALKALLNLIMPVHQAFAALGALLVPAFVTVQKQPSYRRTVYLVLGILGTAALSYWLLVAALAQNLMAWMYLGKYDAYAHVAWLLGSLPILASIATVFGSAIRARERPDGAFWAYAGSAVFTVSIGLVMLVHWEMMGAILGLVLSYGLTAMILWRFYFTIEAEAINPKVHTSLEATIA